VAIEFSVSDVIPASPQEIYDAWLSSAGHEAITGGPGAKASAGVGDGFTAWGGYTSGKNVELEPGRRIVQSWRTTGFDETDADSQIEILLEPVVGGTMLTLRHSNIPDGHTTYREGWQRYYFETMKAHFTGASASV
jgi:uncharacterized protein YndB with AHSA1/START domain